jgi:hypothetical protein
MRRAQRTKERGWSRVNRRVETVRSRSFWVPVRGASNSRSIKLPLSWKPPDLRDTPRGGRREFTQSIQRKKRHFSLIPTAVQGTEQTCTGTYQATGGRFAAAFHRLIRCPMRKRGSLAALPLCHRRNAAYPIMRQSPASHSGGDGGGVSKKRQAFREVGHGQAATGGGAAHTNLDRIMAFEDRFPDRQHVILRRGKWIVAARFPSLRSSYCRMRSR